jgi:hypothetical protein
MRNRGHYYKIKNIVLMLSHLASKSRRIDFLEREPLYLTLNKSDFEEYDDRLEMASGA